MNKKLIIAILAVTSFIAPLTAHALYSCTDLKNEIIKENRKLASFINRRERLEYRFNATLFVYKMRMDSKALALDSAIANLHAKEEQVLVMGYGCLLDPIPCEGPGTRRLSAALTRARAEVSRAQKALESATDTYLRFDAEHYPHTRALDDKIESSQSYIRKLEFSLEICSQQ